MSLDNATNPVVEETAVSAAPEVETTAPETEASETESTGLDENGEPISAPAPVEDTEEVEFEGAKVKVPKLVKDALLRHADYTRKTQELAEQRKAFEASRDQSLAGDKDYVEALASYRAHDAELTRYKNVDWATLEAQDPLAAQQHWRRYTQLKDGLSTAEKAANAAHQRISDSQRDIRAKQTVDAVGLAKKLVPEWAPGNDLDRKLAAFGTEIGLSPKDMEDALIRTPAFIKALNLARIGADSLKKQATEKRIASAQAVTPAVEIGSKAPAAKDPTRMGTDEWMRWRSQQLSKRK